MEGQDQSGVCWLQTEVILQGSPAASEQTFSHPLPSHQPLSSSPDQLLPDW